MDSTTKPVQRRRLLSSFVKKLGWLNHSKASYARLDESAKSTKTTLQVPRGHIAVYVGSECKRYQVPVKYLSHPTFQELIRESLDDEIEMIKINGPFVLSCKTETFDELLKIVNSYAVC